MKKYLILSIILLAAFTGCKPGAAPLPKKDGAITGAFSELSPIGVTLSGTVTTETGSMDGYSAGIWISKPKTKMSYGIWADRHIEAIGLTKPGPFSVHVLKLEFGSDYSYSYKCYLKKGEEYIYGEEITFDKPNESPCVTLGSEFPSESSIVLKGKINVTQADIDAIEHKPLPGFYGNFAGSPKEIPLSDVAADGTFSVTLTGLTPGTYTYRARLVNNGDWGFYGDEMTFVVNGGE